MPDFHIQIPSDSSLSEYFSDMPSELRVYLGKGFEVLGNLRLPANKLLELARTAQDFIENPLASAASSRADIAAQFAISADKAAALITAASFSTVTLRSRSDSAEEFVKALVGAKILPGPNQPHVLSLARTIVDNRRALKESIERARVAKAVLPSLAVFETTIDLRLGFEINNVGFAVPVVVVHLDTDAEKQEIWFQVDKRQIDNLIKDLQETRRRIEEAENWVARRPVEE